MTHRSDVKTYGVCANNRARFKYCDIFFFRILTLVWTTNNIIIGWYDQELTTNNIHIPTRRTLVYNIVDLKYLLLFLNLKKGDKVYQLLAHGRWFSPGSPASSTTKTGRHDLAEILLKVALSKAKWNQINLIW